MGYKHLKTSGRLRVAVEGAAERMRMLPGEAVKVINDYKKNYLGSEIKDLAWSGSLNGCRPGSLPGHVKAKALQRINYFRRMVGLYPIKLDDDLNRLAQAAALIMLSNKRVGHYPKGTWSCYSKEGAKGAAASNLGLTPLKNIITELISDFGKSNYSCGHRRWILNSRAGSMGFGAASDKSHYLFAAEALHVVKSDYRTKRDLPEFIAYPPAGFVPAGLIFHRWSFGITRNKRSVSFQHARIKLSDCNGNEIKITQYPYKRSGGDPSITWDIYGGKKNLGRIIEKKHQQAHNCKDIKRHG